MKHLGRVYKKLTYITSKKVWMIITLLRVNGPLRSTQIQKALNLPQSSVALILSRLHEYGIIEKYNLYRGKQPGRPFMEYTLGVGYTRLLHEVMYFNYLGDRRYEDMLKERREKNKINYK